MPIPEHWKGSDLRSRAEIVQYLHRHGGELSDATGLVVGTMRTELGKGRALSQLLQDMESDGMIKREVRGRRTFLIKLVDDWGLLEAVSVGSTASLVPASRQAVPRDGSAASDGGGGTDGPMDYDALAQALLVRVMRKANEPSKGAEVERYRERAERAQAEVRELKDALIIARGECDEQRRAAESMREELLKLKGMIDKPRKGSVPLRDALSKADRASLDRMMRELPASR